MFEASDVVHRAERDVVQTTGQPALVMIHEHRDVDEFGDRLGEQLRQMRIRAEGFVLAEFEIAPDEFADEFVFVRRLSVPTGTADDGDDPVVAGGAGRPIAVAHFARVAVPDEDVGRRDASAGEAGGDGVHDRAVGNVQRRAQSADLDADDIVAAGKLWPAVGLAGESLDTGGNESASLGGVHVQAGHRGGIADEDDAAGRIGGKRGQDEQQQAVHAGMMRAGPGNCKAGVEIRVGPAGRDAGCLPHIPRGGRTKNGKGTNGHDTRAPIPPA